MVPRSAILWAALWLCRSCAEAGSLAADDERSAAVASFAAEAALRALAEAGRLLEEELPIAEARAVEASKAGPLEAYSEINEGLGRMIASLLSGLRHIAAAIAAAPEAVTASEEQLSNIGDLDQQLLDLQLAHIKEPLFYWHGPKHMLRSKLAKILDARGSGGDTTTLRKRLMAQAANFSGFSASSAAAAQQLQSPASSGSDISEIFGHEPKVPSLGIALGDAQCSEPGEACGAHAAALLRAASARLQGGRPHLLVLPCSEGSLARIREVLREVGDDTVFLSYSSPDAPFISGPGQSATHMKKVMTALGRESLDLLWLPKEAFNKQTWKMSGDTARRMIKDGRILAYGARIEVGSRKLVGKLLDGREPKPSAWLLHLDPSRPPDAGSIAAARDLGVEVVAWSESGSGSAGAPSAYLDAVVGQDALARDAAVLTWALRSGYTSVIFEPPSTGYAAHENVWRLVGVSQAEGAAKVLRGLSSAVGHGLPLADAEGSGKGVEEAISSGLTAARKARTSAVKLTGVGASTLKLTGVGADEEFTPHINPESLEDLASQAEQYKENNHVIYRENFFDETTWDAIVKETTRLWKSRDIDPNCNLDGVNRLGGYVLDHGRGGNSSLYNLIYGNEDFRRWVSEVNGEGDMWPSDFPIELREYGTESQGMTCHPDLQMYAISRKDSEFAMTVDNESPCEVSFWDAAGTKHQFKTKGNSMMMVRANAAVHCVGPTHGGTRTIVKFIYVGDYRKSEQFWRYTGNVCDDSNPNRRVLEKRRRITGGADSGSGSPGAKPSTHSMEL